MPINSEDVLSYNKNDIERIKAFFDNPNRNHESTKFILRAYIKDILELDAGVIVKVFNSGSYEDEQYVEVKDQIGDPKQPSKSVKIKKTFLKQDYEKDKYRLTEIYARDGGCLKFGEMIETDLGFIPIGKIVNDKIQCNVKSYNIETKKIEWKPIINWFNNGVTTDWLRLKAKTNGKFRSLIVTPNHNIWDGIAHYL